MKLAITNTNIQGVVNLPASKSECNRALIIEALLRKSDLVNNVSEAADSQTLVNILKRFSNGEDNFDVGPAGTTLRFLTAFFAIQKGAQVLTGSARMNNRPVGVLVDALRRLGASIDYLGKENYPPIRINEGNIKGGEIEIDGGVSSQYISALMLIAPTFRNGLNIKLLNDLVSKPYIEMTAKLMQGFGAKVKFEDNRILVEKGGYCSSQFAVESDWSAASYWYEILSFAKFGQLSLEGLKRNSFQGDSVVADLYKSFGVETEFVSSGVFLRKVDIELPQYFEYDFTLCPDLAQTMAVTCAGLGVEAKLTGLKTLKIKETDRILALQNELEKLGVEIERGNDWIKLYAAELSTFDFTPSTQIETYKDHRMAMAFAPIAIKYGSLEIEDPGVVVKSYPSFWKDLHEVGFLMED
ncbi:MAG: 3-phosphoshikimate 1-carboxyvinyltransferase [Flavobacteriales bacterium]|nr:3-phosphoshikimate 1-carboxyvinyltransferase [Flavobacteriales bacterium]